MSLPGLALGVSGALGRDAEATVSAALRRRYHTASVRLSDSGTSALVLALRATVPPGGTVALPSYSCVDLAAAARYAAVRVRLYDLEPETLSADLASLEATLRRGADAVVAVHLYGFPVDIHAVASLAHQHGAALIEDAAQAAGSTLAGSTLGGLGDLSVLSFGRGKGTTGGRGGAVMASDPDWIARLSREAPPTDRRRDAGWGDLTRAAAQWLLGRPLLYGIPAAIPALHLGEMIYHPAHEPRPMSRAALSILGDALRQDARELERRRRHAAMLHAAVREGNDLRAIRPIPGAEPGYLRFPVLDGGRREPAPVLGITRGYPRALFEQEELRPCLHAGEPEPLGGRRIRESLFTLPVHGLLDARDVAHLRDWIITSVAP